MTGLSRDPQAVWKGLLEGNRRFAEGAPEHPNQSVSRRAELSLKQEPRAAVLTCGDSRVPVELLFDVGLGDTFVVRTAGEVVDTAVLASLEFAVANLGVELVVVLGHASCGAVEAAAQVVLEGAQVPTGHQRAIVEQIAPSILEAKSHGFHSSADFEREHASAIMRKITQLSSVINAAVEKGETAMVAAHYSIVDGHVDTVKTAGF
ncbi:MULTISPECIES: carbonic anhydrase [unclassified Corynebacterium]|uniref:carbonic anhydrase n=1 Tax=unclassified Corynebacterium TaxID=2624378 RepID=UPI00286E7D87|nr:MULTISPECIES: carbonic anhydrase [unclassified Corynebacterium]